MKPTLRTARPDDVPLVARVLEMAGRGHRPRGPWDFVFPDDAERERALQVVAGGAPSWCQREVFRVAEVDGEGAAALCCFEPKSLGGTSLAVPLGDAFRTLGWSEAKAAQAAAPLGAFMRCFPDMPDGRFIVENVGTLPGHRRRGLVAALLEHALELGRARGFETAQISCMIENDPAFFTYERAGFRVVESFEHPDFAALMGAPGYVRMLCPL